MKHIFVLLFAMVIMGACGNEKTQKDNSATEDLQVTQPTPPPTPENRQPPLAVNVPAGADGIVHHYVCADGCAEGNGEVSSPCPVCGKTLAHNTAFHPQNATPGVQGQNNTTINQVPPPTKEPLPAQNEAGVWHFTCATGCAGGAGAMGSCSKCGGQLAHNKAYH